MIKVFLRTLLALLFLILIFVVISKTLPLPGTIPVLMYRSVGSTEDAKRFKHFVSRRSFVAQMAFLHFFGFRVLSMDEYARRMNGGRESQGREILLTFDSGDLTFAREAWPVLRRYTFPVTLFLVSESLRRESNHSMPVEVVKELLNSGLVTLGSNGRTHASLTELNEVQLQDEIAESKEDLEELFDIPVDYFAYPHGDVDERAVAAVKQAGYRLAFTTSHHQLKGLPETPFTLTRLNISRSADNPIVFWAKIAGLYQMHKQWWYGFKSWLGSLRP